MITALLALSLAAAQAPDDDLAAQVRALAPSVSTLRGLPFLVTTPIEVVAVDALRDETLADLDTDEARAELAALTDTVSVFWQASDDLDLHAAYAAVRTDQIGGFYDPERLRLVLVRRGEMFATDAEIARHGDDGMVAAHELVHALQDQHFDLWALEHRDHLSSDAQLAVRALVEGDATHAMLRYAVEGGEALDTAMTPELFRAWFLAPQQAQGIAPPLADLPPLLRDALVFPYTEGAAWVHAVRHARGADAVDDAFRAPPLSSEHVLHPERWLAGDDPPRWPALPDDLPRTIGRHWTTADDDAFGEQGIRSLFAALGEHAASVAADGWGGDRYQVYRHRNGDRAFVWFTVWDDAAEAGAFEAAAARWIETEAPHLVRMSARHRGPQWWFHQLATWHVERIHDRVVVTGGLPLHTSMRLVGRLKGVQSPPIQTLDAIAPRRPEPRLSPKDAP